MGSSLKRSPRGIHHLLSLVFRWHVGGSPGPLWPRHHAPHPVRGMRWSGISEPPIEIGHPLCKGARTRYLHYDIKPQNIFVRTDHPSGPHGVIGDIDDLVVRKHCDPEEHHVAGTPCYGAPFEHCDPRRDQTALLLTIAETLSDSSWGASCRFKINDPRKTAIEKATQEMQGWATQEPGRYSKWWQPETYRDYAERLEEHRERYCHRDSSDTDPAVRIVARYLKLLAHHGTGNYMQSLNDSWKYAHVHEVRVVMAGPPAYDVVCALSSCPPTPNRQGSDLSTSFSDGPSTGFSGTTSGSSL